MAARVGMLLPSVTRVPILVIVALARVDRSSCRALPPLVMVALQ